MSFAESNPRKLLKKARRPLGNLPLEILNYLGRYVDNLCHDGKLPIPMQQTIACKCPLLSQPSFPPPPVPFGMMLSETTVPD